MVTWIKCVYTNVYGEVEMEKERDQDRKAEQFTLVKRRPHTHFKQLWDIRKNESFTMLSIKTQSFLKSRMDTGKLFQLQQN